MMKDSSFISCFIQLIINFVVYLFFVINAFQGKMKYRSWENWLIIASYVAISTIVILLYLLNNALFPQYRYIVLLLWFIVTIAVALLLFRSNLLEILFLVFVILGIQFNTMKISEILLALNFFSSFTMNKEVRFFLINLSVMLISILPMWYLIVGLFKKVMNRNIDKSYWKYLFIVPIVAYLYCVFHSVNYSLASKSTGTMALITSIILSIFIFLAYVAVLQMVIKTNDSLIANENSIKFQRQLIIQEEQYKKLANNMQETERLWHDMRHHFVTLKGYANQRNLQEIERYLDHFIDAELSKEETQICEKHSVDMILRHYIGLARDVGVEVKASVQLPNTFKVADTDLCVIFGNLIENAVEGCKRQKTGKKRIEVKAKILNEKLLAITIINSYDGPVHQNGENFMSQKHEGIGIGTHSVKSIVEKNGGMYKFDFKNNIFKVSIFIPD